METNDMQTSERKPRSIRVSEKDQPRLEKLMKLTKLSGNAIVNMALSAFLDHAEKEDALPLKYKKGGKGGRKSSSKHE